MRDLWADFANEASLTEQAQRGRNIRQRRLTEQAVLVALRAWLLREYMLPYGASLGATRIFKRCYWIDGLGDTRTPVPFAEQLSQKGIESPPRRVRQKLQEQVLTLPAALQPVAVLASELAQLEMPIALYGLLLDEKRSRRRSELASQAVNGTGNHTAIGLLKESGLLAGCWQEVAPALLERLEQSAAVFLLNPLKQGLFRYTDLFPLYQRAAPTELFLWLSHKQIEARLLPALHTTEGAAALTNLLRGDRWKALITKERENPQRLTRGLIELLADSMRPHFLSVQHIAFPVLSGPAQVEAAPYSLLFATRRQDSLYRLNDAICLRERRLHAESQQGILNEEWFAAQRAEQATMRMQALLQEALKLGRVQRARRWPDLRQQLLLIHFGQNLLTDYDQIISSSLARGDVRCEWRKRAQNSDETLIPGNEDLLLWRQ